MDREGNLGGVSNDEEEMLKRRRNNAQEKRVFQQGREGLTSKANLLNRLQLV